VATLQDNWEMTSVFPGSDPKGVENDLPVGICLGTSVKDARDRDPEIESRSGSGLRIIRTLET